jgi:Fur family transcriptional regulator, zinc uptake regulator
MIPVVVTEYCCLHAIEITPIRHVVLEYLWEHPIPAKAYDMIEVLRQKGIGSPKPPTVYRTIDFLEQEGLLHKVHALNAYVPCHHPGEHQACQLLICDVCGDAKEFCDAELYAHIPLKAKNIGFEPRTSIVEVFGTCKKCTKILSIHST